LALGLLTAADCGSWRAAAARDRAACGRWQSQPLEGAVNMKHDPVIFEKTLLHMHEFSIFVVPYTFQILVQIPLTRRWMEST